MCVCVGLVKGDKCWKTFDNDSLYYNLDHYLKILVMERNHNANSLIDCMEKFVHNYY